MHNNIKISLKRLLIINHFVITPNQPNFHQVRLLYNSFNSERRLIIKVYLDIINFDPPVILRKACILLSCISFCSFCVVSSCASYYSSKDEVKGGSKSNKTLLFVQQNGNIRHLIAIIRCEIQLGIRYRPIRLLCRIC